MINNRTSFPEKLFLTFETFVKYNVFIKIKDIILRRKALNKEDHNVPAIG